MAINIASQEQNKIASLISFGFMVGWQKAEGKSFNVSLGAFVDTDVNVLANGLKNGDETIYTDSADLYNKKDAWGYALMFSSTF